VDAKVVDAVGGLATPRAREPGAGRVHGVDVLGEAAAVGERAAARPARVGPGARVAELVRAQALSRLERLATVRTHVGGRRAV